MDAGAGRLQARDDGGHGGAPGTVGQGDGTVDACYKTIAQLIGFAPKLERYAVKAITGGTDALGEVSCLIYHDGISASGQGAHTDIIQASALAFVNALNKLAFRQRIVIVKNGEQQSV